MGKKKSQGEAYNSNSLEHSAVSIDNDIVNIGTLKLYKTGIYRGSTVLGGITWAVTCRY